MDEVRDAGAFIPFAPDVDARPSRHSALIALDLGPFELPRVARDVRLLV